MLLTEDLDVFKKAHKVTLEIYRLCAEFPKDEKYGLSSQMKRAAVSINSNLMEGSARSTLGERKQFLGISRGSASELQYQVMLSRDIGLIEKERADLVIEDLLKIRQMLSGLMKVAK